MDGLFLKKISRREFLKLASLLGTGLFLREALGQQMEEYSIGNVAVGIARGDTIEEGVKRAVELAGDFEFIKPGDSVLIKPNVNSDHLAPGTTNPRLVGEVVRLAKERGAKKIIVADRSNPWWDTLKAMKKVGIYDAAVQNGAEIMVFGPGDYIRMNPENCYLWEEGFLFPAIVTQVDYVISLPVAKTHIISDFTMAIKNWVGLIPPSDRRILHSKEGNKEQFASMLSEIHLARKPSFIVMDATKVFVSGGPSVGETRQPGLIIATSDLVANDVVGLALLKTLGTIDEIQNKSIWEQPQIKRATKLGLGVRSPHQIHLKTYHVGEEKNIRQEIFSQTRQP